MVEDGAITSIYKTGLHRSESEAAKKHAFVMQVAGGNVSYENAHLKVGMTGIYYFFDRPYEPNLREYARYNLRGNHFYNAGVDYKLRLGRFAWVGEAAKGKLYVYLFSSMVRLISSEAADCSSPAVAMARTSSATVSVSDTMRLSASPDCPAKSVACLICSTDVSVEAMLCRTLF